MFWYLANFPSGCHRSLVEIVLNKIYIAGFHFEFESGFCTAALDMNTWEKRPGSSVVSSMASSDNTVNGVLADSEVLTGSSPGMSHL